MKNLGTFAAVAAAVTLSTSVAFAKEGMEKCHVVKDGVGLIKELRSDCATSTHSCAGQNKAGDPESWIMVPKGDCDKINTGMLDGVKAKILDKIEVSALHDDHKSMK